MFKLTLTKTHTAHLPDFVLRHNGEFIAGGNIDACIDSSIPVYISSFSSKSDLMIVPREAAHVVHEIVSHHLQEGDWEELCMSGELPEPTPYEKLRVLLQDESLAPIRKSLMSTYSCFAGRADLCPDMQVLIDSIEKAVV